jgi:hypothetical protein
MAQATEMRECEHFQPDQAQAIVTEAAHRYFESRRARVDGFVNRHFSFLGALALHRKALGWDIVKAPANIALAVPYFTTRTGARIAGRLGAGRLSAYLAARHILFETAVGREIEWLLMTDLLELPFSQGQRSAQTDALAEAILLSPEIQSALAQAFAAIGPCAADPNFRTHLTRTVAGYAETRAAASEITTAIIMMATGATTLKQVTPGAMVLGPALAATIAYDSAVASFPAGQTLGSLWYSLFPVTASPALTLTVTGGLMAASAMLAAFSGIVTDPLQRMLGLHRRRLLRLIDALERQFNGEKAGAFLTRDHYVARLLSLFELLSAAYRLA